MILVTGASGALGSAIVRKLGERGVETAAGTRNPSDGARRVDFDRPATLTPAFAGVDTLVFVSAGYAEDDVVMERHRNVVEAAVSAGVGHVVYTSLVGAGERLGIALAHRYTERIVRESGIPFTILRNGLYTELFDAFAEANVADGVLSLPLGRGRVAAIPREDLADVAADVALDPSAHVGEVVELAGTEAVGGEELAAGLGEKLGRAIAYEPVPLASFRQRLLDVGVPGFEAAHAISIMANVQAGLLGETGRKGAR
ncbi:NmrA family NAD(P)-binding protein [Salininema proteolyticum]|uniref:NmrA family NAD(P)-binding protein n=1 Tax=Salininema proteolyticum TaxID=1607685 RepID=A0ABV8TXX3_9ACTN